MKKLVFIQNNDSSEKNSLLVKDLSPFLLMDYQGEINLGPNEKKLISKKIELFKGLEIITIVYSSEHEKQNKKYSNDELTPGDIKWINGNSGLIQIEKDILDTEKVVQLWVNFPTNASTLITDSISNHIPYIQLDNNTGKLKVIIGEYSGVKGPFKTSTPINIWDMRLNENHTFIFKVPEGHTAAIFVLSGSILLSDGHEINEAELGLLERSGELFSFKTQARTKLLFLGGEPINEAIIGHATFELSAPDKLFDGPFK